MATLQSSGAISLANLQTTMGGANPISLSEYYRGGAYTPATKTIATREPASGEYFGLSTYQWQQSYSGYGNSGPAFSAAIFWSGSWITTAVPANATSYTTGGYTYYRGALYTSGYTPSQYGGGGNITTYFYYIYRTSSSTVNINTGVPSSGGISLSQFYGAEKP